MQPDEIAEKIASGLAAARMLLGAGRFDEARHACDLVLQVDPRNVGAKHCLGLIALQERQLDVAAGHFAELLDWSGDPKAALLLAMALRESGRAQQAADLLEKLVPVLPARADLLVEQGRSLIDLDRLSEAAAVFEKATVLAPQKAPAHSLLGVVRRRLGDVAGGFAAFQAALALDPRDAVAANGAGNHFLEREDFPAAIACYRQALTVQPQFLEAGKNLAYALSLNGESAAAQAAFEDLLKIAPSYADAHKDFGIFLLSQGDYARGWEEYEARWTAAGGNGSEMSLGLPAWDGAPLQGRHLLLWGEQGIGDQILHGTMLRDAIAQAAGAVTIAVDRRLVPLFARSFAECDVVALGEPVAADVQAPFGSIGRWLSRRPEQRDGAYLTADATHSRILRGRYAALGPAGNRLLGLSWRSISQHVGIYKSLDLEALLPVLRLPGITWLNLQYGDVADELAHFAARHGVIVHQDSSIDAMDDLEGLATQIAALDGVVSASNSTVHLAGALGQRCWVLLPAGRGRLWYWPLQGGKTPWYGSVRLLRQRRAGDWTPVIEEMAGVLAG